ncbi:hypothetical protein ONZ45_g1144 [Pleurotus djamor]|nr:hypothetical protein ONZ45_g1144 [Pleurotus djamor]
MHPTVRHLSLILPENFPTTAGVFSPYLTRRLPSIETLDVALKTQINDIDGLLVSCIEQLSSVKAISLPIAPDKPILETLSRLPHLSKITLKPYNPSTSSPQDFAFGEKAFPELQDVAFSLPYFSATKLLFHPQLPTFLTRIHIESLSSESPADFSDLLTAIADRNPSVVSVRIISSLVERPSRMEFVDMRHMRPILRCSKLRSLELAHFYPFMLFPPDLEEIASAFPHIETLVVNCSPSNTSETTPSPVPISSIIPFASCCPKLRKLGLYFDGSSSLIPRNQPEHVFPRLITLFVGSSTVSNPRRLAFFLSHICPYVTEILTGKQWIDGLCAAPSKEWEELVTLLPLLSEVRTEERVWAKHQNQN